MNYHMIRTDDMLNGDGLRVVLFVSGCTWRCDECHNPETWNDKSGKPFTIEAVTNILNELDKEYISGITFSGGDPLHSNNLTTIKSLIELIKEKYPNKTIWLYTGYKWEEIRYPELLGSITDDSITRYKIVKMCDVLVDDTFKKNKSDINYPYAGSTNQRVIDVKKSLEENKVVLYN